MTKPYDAEAVAERIREIGEDGQGPEPWYQRVADALPAILAEYAPAPNPTQDELRRQWAVEQAVKMGGNPDRVLDKAQMLIEYVREGRKS